MMNQQPTIKYSGTVSVCDPKTNTIIITTVGGAIHLILDYLPPLFVWPEIGDAVVVRKENGTWRLDQNWVRNSSTSSSLLPGQAQIASGQIFDENMNELVAVKTSAFADQQAVGWIASSKSFGPISVSGSMITGSGSTWWTGIGSPTIVTGAVTGDFYINEITGEVFQSSSGNNTWMDQGFTIMGPAGPTGPPGPTGGIGPAGSASTFPTTSVLDTFIRTAENPINFGGSYAATAPLGEALAQTNGTQALSTQPENTGSGAVWNTPFSTPIESYITLAVAPNLANDFAYIGWWKSGLQSGYEFRVQKSANAWIMRRWDATVFTQIAGGKISVNDGDSMGISIDNNGLITAWHKRATGSWTLRGAVVDTTYTGSGFVAFRTFDTATRWTNFGGGVSSYVGPIWSPPVLYVNQSATPAINTDYCRNGDVVITGLAQAITGFTMSGGIPPDSTMLRVHLLDNGTGRAITWGSGFESGVNTTLPVTTVASTMLTTSFIWNPNTLKWRCVWAA